MQPQSTIPLGLCQCGCGQRTTVITADHPAAYHTAKAKIGVPRRYITGHNALGRYRPDAKRTPLDVRFWRFVQKTDSCWLWTGGKTLGGYGVIANNGAHRLSWELHRGPIPPGMFVCHNCDRNYPKGDISYRRCVNPDHLFLGSPAANIHDMDRKGRSNRPRLAGEQGGNARLSEAQVRAIRVTYAASKPSQRELAATYGVSDSLISAIVRRVAWKHLD